ncbi:MAG: preprotein translocase subunit SecE [Deltaproteobacteria bacterium CG11_big_fil_rev_8_21_14_0_20_45_16]|nr:MAG: preprotein translocase subunit SecE [Deltaproteobacteria bacterium CG11_big_fil_rev_8_21_14_0_20_45_16]
MGSEFRKFTVLSFLIITALCAYVLYLILTQFADVFRFGGSNVFNTGYSWTVVGGSATAVLGLIVFIFLSSNKRAVDFSDDVFSEIKKTTWPNFKETSASTLVVSIMVLIAALMFLLIDAVWGNIFRLII